MEGQFMAYLGLALCTALCGIGSAIGLFKTGSAASGVLAENPKKFSKVIILVVLPATQGIYGFVITILGSSAAAAVTTSAEGLRLFAAVMPMAIVGCLSAIYQGLTAASGICAVARQDSLSGKLILFPAMVEFYAILALVISIMLM